jgi:oligoendopeptidase F
MHALFLPAVEADTPPGVERDRGKIPERYRWDLTPVYSSDAAWKAAKERFALRMKEITACRGTVTRSAADLLRCLELVTDLAKEHTRLASYAGMRSDEDTRDSHCMGMEQEITQLGAEFAALTAFIEPDIIAGLDSARLDEFVQTEQGLGVHRHNLADTLRRKEHTLSEPEETILANASLVADGPATIYGVFSDADFPFPTVELEGGRRVRLDKSAFNLERASVSREDRKKVFAAYFGALHAFRRTYGAQLNAEVRKNVFYARSRRHRSCLHRALDGGNIPEAVYRGLVENVNANLGTFHRYLALRRKILKVGELHYYDLYAPLVGEVDLRYGIEEAMALTLDSLRPLGADYVEAARRGLAGRWLDVYPSEGKRSGAYSNGAVYDVHPYMLLNYNGKYDDVSTLTHELGHTMHSWYTNRAQHFANANYSIFVAEVASTLNEALLLHHMLETVTDPRARLSLLGNHLDGIRGTVFRQTQFAEFELAIHERAERGESLTGDTLSELSTELARRYYGHDQGICIVDPEISAEWAHIPHFYYNFYVYQYATSFTASAAIAERILQGDADAVRLYRELLSAGGSDFPIELLRRAGVDMTAREPFDLTMRMTNWTMDEMEGLLEGGGAG